MSNKVEVRLNRIPEFTRNLRGLKGAKVGYLQETTANIQYENGLNLATNAFYQTQGTVTADGSQRIPPRDFMTYGADQFGKETGKIASIITDGVTENPAQGNARLGVFMQSHIQSALIDGPWEPNAASTVRMKGSSKPLVDTGRLRQGVDSIPK